MLQLTQLYHAAASDLLDAQQLPQMARSMMDSAVKLPNELMQAQLNLLTELVSQQLVPPLDSVLRPLYTSMEVPACALQLIVAACVDLHKVYKDKAAKQQQLKTKNKKKAADSKVAVNSVLLKIVVPADHEEVGVPTGWENGIISMFGSERAGMTSPANICQIMEIAVRNHLIVGKQDATAAALQQSYRPWVPVCGVGVMKLVLEATLLLQGTEPEAGVHHELQRLLHSMIGRAAREDVVVLLEERGELLMQAATLTAPEEWVLGECSDSVPARDRDRMRVDRGNVQEVEFDWLDTLMCLADRIGELCWASCRRGADHSREMALAMRISVRFAIAGNGS